MNVGVAGRGGLWEVAASPKGTGMLSSLAIFAAAAKLSLYSGPAPEQTAIYGDWITGCDNERNCAAVALVPVAGAGEADHLEVLIEQPLGYKLDPVVTITPPVGLTAAGGAALHVDGAAIALPPAEAGRFVVKGPSARALVGALLSGLRAAMRDAGGKDIARASLAGLTAALLRTDAQQGKVDTPRALARPGTRRPYDDLPGFSVTLTRPARSQRPPAAPDAQKMAELRAGQTCPVDRNAPDATPQGVRLGDESTMLIMPWRCGDGAYNHYSDIMIVNGFGEVAPAKFDFDNGVTGDGPGNVLVNAGWLDSERVLESHILHRAIGDCGRIDRFIWDGEQFRLSEQRVMPECRGSMARIGVWQVDVAER